jgi:protein-S-isoprenylcysteine O-methyltransferase Ste14
MRSGSKLSFPIQPRNGKPQPPPLRINCIVNRTLFFSGIAPLWPVKLLLSFLIIGAACLHVTREELPWGIILFGNVFILSGALLELWHYRILKRETQNLGSPTLLVTHGGLLSLIRHPMYLGDVVMLLGFTLFMQNAIAWGLYVLFVLVVMGLCAQEDRAMENLFPEAFSNWRKRSWRILPGVF